MSPSIGVRGVMLENTFLSIGAMVDHWMPAVAPFKQFVLQVHFPSDKRIGQVTIPIMFISGAEDAAVPAKHSATLHKLATSAPIKEVFESFDGAHHNTWKSKGYKKSVNRFFAKCEGIQVQAQAPQPAAQPPEP